MDFVRFPSFSFQHPRELTHLPLAGQNLRTTVQLFCLLHREFLPRLKIHCFEIDTVQMACRFPNAIPSGTRVPQWALLDVTVRCYVFFFSVATYSQRSRLVTIGIPISQLPLVVRIFSSSVFPSSSMSHTHVLSL